MRKSIILTAALGTALFGIGCGSDYSVGPKQAGAPQLPPQASMTIPSMGGERPLAKQSAAASTNAFVMAYTAVSYWTLTVQQGLLEPAALFALAHSAEPRPLADNSGWQWQVGDAACRAILIARVEADSVRWSMTVTSGPTSFTWYTGTSTITGNDGSWTFYDTSIVNGVHPAIINVSFNTSLPIPHFKVSVVKQGDPALGSYLQWSAAGADKTFQAYDAAKPQLVVIGWNDLTEAGWIENATTGEKACWGGKVIGHADIACTQ